jgi:DNA-binding GntR family transcriptional regulator
MSETIRTHTQNHNHSIISSLNDHKEIFYYIEENNISKANDALDSHINYWINDRLEKITNNQIA